MQQISQLAREALLIRSRATVSYLPILSKNFYQNQRNAYNREEHRLTRHLNDFQFHITQLKGTEPAYSNEFHDDFTDAKYHCVVCEASLFSSQHKFECGTGWPSFTKPDGRVKVDSDYSHGMAREEVRCGQCDAHLGHRFPDGPRPSYWRYTVNSASLTQIRQ